MVTINGDSIFSIQDIRSGGELPPLFVAVMDQYSQIVTETKGGAVHVSVREVK